METSLSSIGWGRPYRRGDLFRSTHAGPIVWQMSLNGTVSRSSGDVDFRPALGVALPEAVELEGRFLGLPKSSNRTASTFGVGLRDLLPAEERKPLLRWCITGKRTVHQVASTIFDDFSHYGLHFFGEFTTEESMVRYLEGRKRSQDVSGKLAILYAIARRDEEALVELVDYMREARTQSPPISVQSWNFVRAFVDRFGIGESLLVD